MKKTLTTNYTLKEEEIKQYKERIEKEIPEALLDLKNGNKIRTINSYMDYLLNEIFLEEIEKYTKLSDPEFFNRFRFDSMCFNINDICGCNKIILSIIYTTKENTNIAEGVSYLVDFNMSYDIKEDKEYIDSVVSSALTDNNLNDTISDIISAVSMVFSEELLYVIRAMREYNDKIKSIIYSLVGLTAHNNMKYFKLLNSIDSNGDYIHIAIEDKYKQIRYIDLEPLSDGHTQNCHCDDEYMNLGKSILYAIRNMIDNQLF